jgi:phage I-like protein
VSKKNKTSFRPSFRQAMDQLNRQRSALVYRLHQERPEYYPTTGDQWTLRAADIPYAELWATVRWTQAAADMIRADEYRYISAEFDLDAQSVQNGKGIGAALTAVGLVNRPFVKGMAPIAKPRDDNVSDIMILMSGEWYHPIYGRLTIEPRQLQEMQRNVTITLTSIHEASPYPDTDLMVDYNHGSHSQSPETARAAGWIDPVTVRVMGATEPTAATEPRDTGDDSMTDQHVRKLLALADDVEITDEHRTQADAKLDEILAATEPEPETEQDPPALSEPEPGDTPEIVQLREQAAAGVEALKMLREQQAAASVEAATQAGKLLPAQREWAHAYALADPAGFAAFVAAQPRLVSTGRDGTNGYDPRTDAERIEASLADSTKNGMDLAEAQKQALKQFGEAAFNAWRKPQREGA